jgi:DNA-binding CsgD family transcriptional regulator
MSAIFVPRHSTGLVAALVRLGELSEAGTVLERGLQAARTLPPSSDLARLLILAADLAEAGDNDQGAEDRLHEALAVAHDVGARSLATTAIEHLAAIAVRQESDAEAVRLFAGASALRDDLGRRAGNDGMLAPARARLDAEAYAAAWSEGMAMSLDQLVAYAARGRGARKRPPTGWASLTPTEHAVVRLVAEGLTNPQIGDRMFISKGTVRTHLSHVFSKLGVTSRSQLASEATKRGLD